MIFIKLLWKLSETATFTVQQECRGILAFKGDLAMNKDFECCCGFLADMIMKYAPEIKDAYNIDTLQQCDMPPIK